MLKDTFQQVQSTALLRDRSEILVTGKRPQTQTRWSRHAMLRHVTAAGPSFRTPCRADPVFNSNLPSKVQTKGPSRCGTGALVTSVHVIPPSMDAHTSPSCLVQRRRRRRQVIVWVEPSGLTVHECVLALRALIRGCRGEMEANAGS